MSSLPICPLLSIRNPDVHELCVGESCALYLPNVNRCSLVYIGYKAFAELQKLQQAHSGSSASAKPTP
ncbi:MAG: hypothetical protein VKK59_07610 [Vampirovibrionales bacterium]|nr:hypothetical protein [Vampirovibrionales bacterium]